MSNHLIPATVVAFLVSAGTVWITRKLALRFKLFDPPGPLKIHRGPIPRLGGVGIVLGFSTGAAIAIRPSRMEDWSLIAALVLVWTTGLIDDLIRVPPVLRLAVQIVAGVLVYEAGLSPLKGASPFLCAIATCLTVVVFTNAFNFLDGSDGIAGGTAAIAATGFALLMAHIAPIWSMVAACLAAACAGFLPFNFPPARIFMGDSGSTSLGLMLAILAMRFNALAGYYSLVPVIVVSIPLIDFGMAVLRRVLARRSVFEGDRSHFYDLLLKEGWSPRRVALSTYVGAVGCVALGLILTK